MADYTAILSRRLVEVSNGEVEPVLIHAGKDPADTIEVEFPVVDQSGEQSAGALASTVRRLSDETNKEAAVLLEYSGYGYAKRGAPLWLARGLRRVCEEEGIPLVTMFHELYATGPPWTSAFWLSPIQALIIQRIAVYSDGIVTNRISSKRWLCLASSDKTSVQVQPVFSNVGEPDTRRPFSQRKNQAVVFGGERSKRKIYQKNGKRVREYLRSIGVTQVIDVGAYPNDDALAAFGLPVFKKGILPSREVSRYIGESKIGIGNAPSDCVTKSGSVAAYLAHGTIPLLIKGIEVLQLKKATFFIELKSHKKRNLKRVSKEGKKWYDKFAKSGVAANQFIDIFKEII
ncbi:hypothetical protein [Salinibacter ruber]|uniref:hypothetical protein n=1 Tax=Salinibacter ruber TaxID=146919 RepID=UPI0016128B2A|nr:hypothetical protein [Salinibacter ruber]MBB4062398.1 hypothetical protein [Salinibacter ruber]